ncbi:hypothetical protein SAMN05421788_112173 [Filimonas lacunae]|uniref:N-acetyltransferase domain-containing protein n=1 Tax=Filimonas lacunae TaxID=477680 RepID=A0A173ML43_9BACT|nr:N-acetyltransferase [Filimonas lacunae]BAV08365.1 hypothetical protein FLA_4401 [Filimonas lacunae]SIT33461.1 hypothetical protein SAMN05421788_112173 [Filimonas lacunae]
MDSKIVTQFVVASEQGVKALLELAQTITREKFASLLSPQKTDKYLAAKYSKQALIDEVNNLSNQWLVVYVNDKPTGFARITSKGERPEMLAQKRVVRIADFGILNACANEMVRQSLWDKCCAVCKSYEAIWMHEYAENPLIAFFESQGFRQQEEAAAPDELLLPSVYLIKQA